MSVKHFWSLNTLVQSVDVQSVAQPALLELVNIKSANIKSTRNHDLSETNWSASYDSNCWQPEPGLQRLCREVHSNRELCDVAADNLWRELGSLSVFQKDYGPSPQVTGPKPQKQTHAAKWKLSAIVFLKVTSNSVQKRFSLAKRRILWGGFVFIRSVRCNCLETDE